MHSSARSARPIHSSSPVFDLLDEGEGRDGDVGVGVQVGVGEEVEDRDELDEHEVGAQGVLFSAEIRR